VTNDGDVMTCDRIHAIYGNVHSEPLADIHERMYKQFIQHKSFCLLETCKDQWLENNRRAGRDYSVDLLGSTEDPFNVFEGTPLMENSVKGSTIAQQVHEARRRDSDKPTESAPLPTSNGGPRQPTAN